MRAEREIQRPNWVMLGRVGVGGRGSGGEEAGFGRHCEDAAIRIS